MIRRYPSSAFYDNRITDGPGIDERHLSPLLSTMTKVFQRLTFFDLLNSQESIEETSKTNREEAIFTVNLINHIFTRLGKSSSSELSGKIGIITPYKAQVRLLKDLLRS